MESAIVMIAFVIVAAAIAFVVLNMGFATSQKAKTSILSSLKETSGSLQISGTIIGIQCLTGGNDCDSSLAAIAIPLRVTSNGESVNLESTRTIVRYQSNTVEYSDIYTGTLDTTLGFVHVVDSINSRFQIFDSDITHKISIGSSGTGNGQFNGPGGIAVDSSGKIYVTDYFNDRIQIFDSSGTYLSQFGSSGTGNGQFNAPYDIAVNSFNKSFISSIGLAAGNALITSTHDSVVGSTVSQTASWIFFPVTISYNSILDQGEHAMLVIVFKASDRPSFLDKIKVEIIVDGGSTLSIERQVPTISNAIIDLG